MILTMKEPRRKPTDAELGILRVLWSRGPSTVRQIAEVMDRAAGYTTILKLLQIMTEKRLVVRDETARTHIYEAAFSEDQTQRQLVTDRVGRQAGPSGAVDHQGVPRRARRDSETARDQDRRLPMTPFLQNAGWALIH